MVKQVDVMKEVIIIVKEQEEEEEEELCATNEKLPSTRSTRGRKVTQIVTLLEGELLLSFHVRFSLSFTSFLVSFL